MHQPTLEDIEVDLFVEAVRRRHGYDFSHYARASLKRRVLALPQALGRKSVSDLIPLVVHEAGMLSSILSQLSVPVTEMFRDPEVFLALRKDVLPLLQSYPRINIWQVGCATGEEAYSLAIMLAEEGLYHRTQIIATDINDIALAKAEEGILAADGLARYAANYAKAGGTRRLADYFKVQSNLARIDEELKKNIMFAHHNVVSEGVFCEAQLVICRNVLIYFDRVLQAQVLGRLRDSLARGGILCLGAKETLALPDAQRDFTVLDEPRRIYRRTARASKEHA